MMASLEKRRKLPVFKPEWEEFYFFTPVSFNIWIHVCIWKSFFSHEFRKNKFRSCLSDESLRDTLRWMATTNFVPDIELIVSEKAQINLLQSSLCKRHFNQFDSYQYLLTYQQKSLLRWNNRVN